MSKKIFDIGVDGRIDLMHDSGAITVEHDVSEIIADCKRSREENDKMRGFRKPETFRHVASIPMSLISVLRFEKGMDILNDDEAMFKFLNDPQYAAFRASTGTV